MSFDVILCNEISWVFLLTPLSLPQLLLYEGAVLQFTNNVAVDQGAGMYVEYTSSDFVLAVLNRGCFIQYFTTFIDIPPNQWVSKYL